MKLDKETLKKVTRKLTDEEKNSVLTTLDDHNISSTPEECRAYFEKIYPKVDETWWNLREQIIAGIEGHTGTLDSIRWRDVSPEDMQKILVILHGYIEQQGWKHSKKNIEDLIEKSMWCGCFEEEFGDPRVRQHGEYN